MKSSTRKRVDRPFQCVECGKRMTVKQAEKASFGADGCSKCGSSDIDLATGGQS